MDMINFYSFVLKICQKMYRKIKLKTIHTLFKLRINIKSFISDEKEQ